MKIGITGGFGFIGSNLAMRLIHQNHDLVVIDDMSTGLQSNLKNSRLDSTLFPCPKTTDGDLSKTVKKL